MSLANSSIQGYWVQFHEEGQSPYNYETEKHKAFWFYSGDEVGFVFENQIQTQKINKQRFSCNDDDNSKGFTECVNDYYEENDTVIE